MEKLIIIDGNSLINRAFYALPLLTNADGEFSNAVYGFCNMLIKTITDHKPDHIIVAFDYGKKNFRHKLFADYKGTRKPTPEELKSQFPLLKKVLGAMNITMYEREGIEADDIIGALAKKFQEQTYILTGDKDALQLVDNTTSVWLTRKGISDIEEVNISNIKEKFSLTPAQVIEFKALSGDSSDNIPGVSGIGEKTALDLLSKYESVDGVYAHIDEIKGALQQKLISGKDMAYLSKTLATIDVNAKIDCDIETCVYDFPFSDEVYDLFKKYNFNSLIRRQDLFKKNFFETGEQQKESAFERKLPEFKEIVNIQELNKAISEIKEKGEFSFILNDSSINFCCGGTEFVVNFEISLFNDTLSLENVIENFKEVFESEKIGKIVYGFKDILTRFKPFNINFKNILLDTDIAYYLIDGGQKSTLEKVVNRYGEAKFPAWSLFNSKQEILMELKSLQLENLYYNIEFPLTIVLFDMQQAGFKIDAKKLNELSGLYSDELKNLNDKIMEVAGCNFNVNSPKQLGKLLFEDLNLPHKNNKKLSTSIDVLEELASCHEIVPLIIRYRKVAKLLSTYIEGFKNLLEEDNVVHTVFNQTLTATGRLSSSEPNLQNIPVRTEEGKHLRSLFISRFENGKIVDADYSQIELRIMAHISGDPKLIQVFKDNKDIHTAVASYVFGVKPEDVTPNMRRQAKAINFGIIYGISAFGLSESMGTNPYEAKSYMDKYFETYSGVRDYMQNIVKTARENNGVVRTMFNRIRRVTDIFSMKATERVFGERAVLNAPIQGTASDIIKIAMINVANRLKKEKMKSLLVLQVHDELLLDCPLDEAEHAKQILTEEMENVVSLSVPLIVDASIGKSWFECH